MTRPLRAAPPPAEDPDPTLPDIEVRVIFPGDALYDEAREVRYRSLYADLGLGRSLVEDTDGRTYHHLVALVRGYVVGHVRVHLEHGENKIYQLCVDAPARGRGIAGALMDRAEALGAAAGRSEMVLDARAHVVSFYAARGYEVAGGEFLSPRTGTPHFPMRKTLGTYASR